MYYSIQTSEIDDKYFSSHMRFDSCYMRILLKLFRYMIALHYRHPTSTELLCYVGH